MAEGDLCLEMSGIQAILNAGEGGREIHVSQGHLACEDGFLVSDVYEIGVKLH